LVGQRKSNGEDVTMSNFPMPDYMAESAARLEKMSKEFGETLPMEMVSAINLMSHPATGVAAMTALGFGLAGQAFGLWAGAMAGAAEASQRLFAPLAPNADKPSAASQSPATVTTLARPKPLLKVVAKTEPAPVVVVKAEPAPTVVAKAEPTKRVVAKAGPKVATAPKVEPAPAAAKAASPELMPEDFHKPRAMKRPAAPDDLKAISGIGPKLEKVLNDLGVWTYAQVAGWSKEEVAWVDDYLSFSGRIGRDKWIEQAAALVAASAKPRKG
jgi:NADH-quinone oxidoreductase subunit E